ncbi:MAG: ATPase domain-containing protein [Desulfurococcaceae archaeon]
MSKEFSIGVEGLDEIIGPLRAPYTLLILGHPGAGKTTLASTICYRNALRGRKSLYVTFYENKEKLYENMRRVGLGLREVEEKGLFKFVKLPISTDVEPLIGELNKILGEGYEVVAVDTINALLEAVGGQAEKRAWLLNYFYQLPHAIDGLLVLVAELPLGAEALAASSLEFAVDAIVVLKHKIEDGFIVRKAEVRKARGAPLHLVEVHFSIVEGKGIVAHAPPLLEEIPSEAEEVPLASSVLKEAAGHVHRGFVINYFHPPHLSGKQYIYYWLLALALKHKARILVISYTTPPQALYDVMLNALARRGVDRSLAEEEVKRRITIKALNPFAYSISELVYKELGLIEDVKPDVVVFDGVHLPRATASQERHIKELFNEVLYLKSRGITVVRVGACIEGEEVCSREASISDLTVVKKEVYRENRAEPVFYVYRRHSEPSIIGPEGVAKFVEEVLSAAVEAIQSGQQQP